jgi:hypothetical protein
MHRLRSLRPLLSPYRYLQISTRQTLTHSIISTPFSTTTANMAASDPVPTNVTPTQDAAAATQEEPSLPKLTPHEFQIYHRMAEHMDYFHNHFRSTWNVLYTACETGKRSKGMSIRQFIALGQQFCSQLEMHHGIEERYVLFHLLLRNSLLEGLSNLSCTNSLYTLMWHI